MLFGGLAIGLDLPGRMPIGSQAIGNQEDEVGSGSMATGSIVETDKLGVGSSEKKYFLNYEVRTHN